MKNEKLFTSLFAVCLMMASCSQEEAGGGTSTTKGDAYITIGVGMNSNALTKALDSPENVNGDATENEIKRVRVIFFDAAGTNVTEIKSFTAPAPEIGSQDMTGSTSGAKAFKVLATSKKIMVVVNATPALEAITVPSTYTAVNAAASSTVAELAGTNGFEMTNATATLIDITSYLKESAAASEAAPAKINVDRCISKVKVSTDLTAVDAANTNANITDMQWQLNVTNKKYFPMSECVATASGTGVSTSLHGLTHYRVDPNYSDNATTGTYLTDNYNTFATPIVTTGWNASDALQYCLENTQNQAGNMHAYSTQAVVKIKYAPKKVSGIQSFVYDPGTKTFTTAATFTPEDLAGGTSWFSIGDVFYSWNSLKQYALYEMAYYDQVGASYATPRFDALKQFCTDNSITLFAKTDAATDYAARKTALDGLALPTTVDGQQTTGSGIPTLNFYKDAENYYAIIIKHDSNADSGDNALGEFGVVRNNYYKVSIAEVMHQGDPIIVTPDPDDPDEETSKWLTVNIIVNPWTVWTQSVNL